MGEGCGLRIGFEPPVEGYGVARGCSISCFHPSMRADRFLRVGWGCWIAVRIGPPIFGSPFQVLFFLRSVFFVVVEWLGAKGGHLPPPPHTGH